MQARPLGLVRPPPPPTRHFASLNTCPRSQTGRHPAQFVHPLLLQVPEYAAQAATSALLLLSGNWVLGVLHAALTAYHLQQVSHRRHLADVTEIFRQVSVISRITLARWDCLSHTVTSSVPVPLSLSGGASLAPIWDTGLQTRPRLVNLRRVCQGAVMSEWLAAKIQGRDPAQVSTKVRWYQIPATLFAALQVKPRKKQALVKLAVYLLAFVWVIYRWAGDACVGCACVWGVPTEDENRKRLICCLFTFCAYAVLNCA